MKSQPDDNSTPPPQPLDYATAQRRAEEDFAQRLLIRPPEAKTSRKRWGKIYIIGFVVCAALMFFVFKFIFWYKSLLENAMSPR